MGSGAITGYIDVAQIALYVFWGFFAALVYYLHRENKREGYPLESDRSGGRIKVQGFPSVPRPKSYLLRSGRRVHAPNFGVSRRDLALRPLGRHLGSPLVPTGNPMLDGVGPASYADRADVVDLTAEDRNRVVPLRVARDFHIASKDPDPRGYAVVGADGVVGGTVHDIWVDRSESVFRYLEVSVPNAARGPHVLVPLNFCKVRRGRVRVRSVLGGQLAHVPRVRHPDQVTLLEEERIMAYFGGGTLYATPARQEPLL